MESLSRSDQTVLAAVAVLVGLLVLVSLRGSQPGAPARIGTIVAGLVLLLALIVGLRAHELASPRADERPVAAPIRPTAAQAFGGAVLTGDPQVGLTVHAPAGRPTVQGAYLSDSTFCDGRLAASVRIDANSPAGTAGPETTASAVATVASATYGLVLSVRATPDPTAPAALSIEYTPADQRVRLVAADGTTLATLNSATMAPEIAVELRGTNAAVWFDGQRLTADEVPVPGRCGAVRFGAWGGDATLRGLLIEPA